MSAYSGIHIIQGEKAIWLQRVGYVAAKPIEQFKKGDILAYDCGGTGIFISKKEVSPKFWEITTKEEDDYGEIYHRKVKKGTLKPYYKPRTGAKTPKPKTPKPKTTPTTAEYRKKAWDAKERGQWAKAAKYYALALKHYPPHQPGSQIAIADKAGLQQLIDEMQREAQTAAKPAAKPKATPRVQRVFIKGDAKKVERGNVSWLANEGNTVARFKSWNDARMIDGGLYQHRIYQGVPFTQEELGIHYPELKQYTGLTKAKIGSAKVAFKDVQNPLTVQYQGYTYMVAPTIPEDRAQRLPLSMTKPKLTAEQRRYLDAHKKEDVAGCWQEIEFFQVEIEEAIREAKQLQKQGKRVQIGEFAPTGRRPLYTVMVLVGGSSEGGQDELTRARELGKAGYRAGKQGPGQDTKIIDMSRQRSHDAGPALMAEWYKGWHAEQKTAAKPAAKPKTQPVARKPAPNLPPILTAPPELTADVLGVGQPPTPTAAPKARKPAARKPAPAPNLPPILTAPPELTADVLGTGPMGLTPAPATKPKRKPKKTAAKPAKKPKTTKKPAKPKAKTPAAAQKLTAAQREHLAIQGFVMVRRGGKYVKITR